MIKYKGSSETRLTEKEAVQMFPWLKQCDFSGGVFYTRPDGQRNPLLIYEKGVWHSGDFKGSEMLRCEFQSGKMSNRMSHFTYGIWFDGIFEGFRMRKSKWITGTFRHGYFTEGEWFNGKFEYGVFENSTWHNGEWGENSHARLRVGLKGRFRRYLTLPRKMKAKRKRGRKKNVKDATKNNILTAISNMNVEEEKKARKERSDKGKPRKKRKNPNEHSNSKKVFSPLQRK